MLILLFLGCHSDGADSQDGNAVVVEEGAGLYDDTRVLEVTLTLDDADWEALRNQTRTVWDTFAGDCLAQPFDSPFDWYVGDATVDGVSLGAIGVRKKGFLGSLDATRPSLKLALDHLRGDTEFDGVTRLTLNNGHEDPTGLHTCLAYSTYTAAGVPAPRCTLAHVTVNGEDLGVYANVEPVDEDFLARHGLARDGGLFEGTLSDFREGWTGTFDPKTHASDVAQLDRVKTAIDTGDLAAIAEVVELDAYLDFWAAEVLVGQWDGYDANTNNYFVYDDPSTGRIRFIPWGADATFDRAAPFAADWVAANSALSRAVLLAPGGEEAYRAHLLALLDDAWDGEERVAEVNRLADLAEPWQGEGYRADVRVLREIVEGKEDLLRAALDADPAAWNGALRDQPCFVERGSIAATFSTSWGTLGESPWTTGSMTMDLTWDGAVVPLTPAGAVAGAQGETAVVATLASKPDGSYLVSYVYFPVDALTPSQLPFDFVDVVGVLLSSDGASTPSLVAYAAEGGVTLDLAGSGAGDAVQGHIAGTLFSYGW
ncbi:MAG: CotH kinase family protein [Pseudomonadota bacterium]|nr:CotH kinase family protein [Pseudomonadota bacterium]